MKAFSKLKLVLASLAVLVVIAASLWLTSAAGSDEAESRYVIVTLPALTIFLAFANLYLTLLQASPELHRSLTPRSFLNVPFWIYVSVYLLLAVLVHYFLRNQIDNWFVRVAVASLTGIGLGNADVKFGSFSVLPLAEFLQALEQVVLVAVGSQVRQSMIAKVAELRHQLASEIDEVEDLRRECVLLGLTDNKLEEMKGAAVLGGDFDESIYRARLAEALIEKSEANAHRLLEQNRIERNSQKPAHSAAPGRKSSGRQNSQSQHPES